jgi:hypothetical protein
METMMIKKTVATMIKRTFTFALVVAAATLALGGGSRAARRADNAPADRARASRVGDDKVSGVASVAARVEDQPDGEELREEFHQTYPLARDGRVSLKNINGAARIVAWDREEVRVDAIKRARSRQRLEEAKVEVDAASDAVSVRTRYPSDELRWEHDSRDNPASVEYTLTVPRGARIDSVELINGGLEVEGLAGLVKATCINGQLVARNLAGEARLSTINGILRAEFDRFEEGKTITLNSVNGTVDLIVPDGAGASVKADTVHGSIANDFGLSVKRGEYVGESLDGQLGGGGGARVKLSNVNGAIRIRRAGGRS